MGKQTDRGAGTRAWGPSVSRRSFVGGAGLAAAAMALAGCSARGTRWETGARDAGSADGRTLDQIKASGRLDVAVLSDAAPLGYVNSLGNYGGYDVFFAGRLAQELGTVANYVACDPAGRTDALVAGEADVVVAMLPVTEATSAVVDLTVPYLRTTHCLVSRADAPLADLSETAGRTVIACEGSEAANVLAATPEVGQRLVGSYADATRAMEAGEGDALLADFLFATEWVSGRSGYVAGEPGVGGWRLCAAGVRKGSADLLKRVNEVMSALGGAGFFTWDYRQTLGSVLGEGFDYRQVVVEGGKVLADEA